jgi:hypothetical protein
MSRACTICQHPDREAIDKALADPKQSIRGIARTYCGSVNAEDALSRHKAEHLPATLAKAQEAREVSIADDLLLQVKNLRNKAISILLKAENAGDLRTALLGIREARACIELLLEVEGELKRNPTINILIAPEWLSLRSALLVALHPYPEARRSVVEALTGVEHG